MSKDTTDPTASDLSPQYLHTTAVLLSVRRPPTSSKRPICAAEAMLWCDESLSPKTLYNESPGPVKRMRLCIHGGRLTRVTEGDAATRTLSIDIVES